MNQFEYIELGMPTFIKVDAKLQIMNTVANKKQSPVRSHCAGPLIRSRCICGYANSDA